MTDLGGVCLHIVVPKGRQNAVLKLALLGGYFSIRNTRGLINHLFTWPSMVRDIKEWCMTCEVCQKPPKTPGGKPPLNPSPVITEPFSCIAFDLVGPIPRITSGYKCILEKWFLLLAS